MNKNDVEKYYFAFWSFSLLACADRDYAPTVVYSAATDNMCRVFYIVDAFDGFVPGATEEECLFFNYHHDSGIFVQKEKNGCLSLSVIARIVKGKDMYGVLFEKTKLPDVINFVETVKNYQTLVEI